MRASFFQSADDRFRGLLDPRRVVRWLYLARFSVATAIYVAAVLVWQDTYTDKESTLVASLTFALTMVLTVPSAIWTEVQRKPPTLAFMYGQFVFDLLVVTSVVHVTGGAASGFAALYILINATGALLLPARGALLVAGLGSMFYVADVILVESARDDAMALTANQEVAILLQLLVFVGVALGTSAIAARLRERGQGTERLEAELASARLRAADILANIRSAIVTVDEFGRLQYANPMASEVLGLPLGIAIGHSVLGDLSRIAPVVGNALDHALRDHVHLSRAEGFLTRDGHVFPVGVTTTSDAGDGEHVPRTATAIFQDISDQKRLEQLNLRAQRLEAVAELSASLAHEIRNPLASIQSAVEQMSRRPAATDDERTLGNLIVRESGRLSRVLTEFLDFARVRVTRMESVDLGQIARGAAALALAHPNRAEGVRLDVEVDGDTLPFVGDEDLLHRAIFNLVLNALQATPTGRGVHVTARAIGRPALPSGVSFDGGAFEIVVADEGPGIHPEIAERLFEPFSTTKPGGTGLGLAVTHRAIEAHKGYVLVDTDRDGTRFTVLLPRDTRPTGDAE
ncbi:MAG: PAS domain S-box protein [Gemmatimonadetes bacterium]|nr:PAS domain S-box protein [Gemmatimonadota bacterium]